MPRAQRRGLSGRCRTRRGARGRPPRSRRRRGTAGGTPPVRDRSARRARPSTRPRRRPTNAVARRSTVRSTRNRCPRACPLPVCCVEQSFTPKGRNMSRPSSLTTTSYAILGLLAVKPWTTHELVQQVDRSLRRIWPRAASKLYEEPKKLVAHGYARATDDSVGRRPRTRYTITANGRRALAAWLQTPGDGPVLEFESLLKIGFADSGSRADIIANLAATRAWVL